MLVDDHDTTSHDLPARLTGITTPLPVPTEYRGLYIRTSEPQLPRLIESMERPAHGDRIIGRHDPAGYRRASFASRLSHTRSRDGVPGHWYTASVASTNPRVQVTLDSELAAAVAEFGGTEPRSRAVRDLALRGAEAIRAERADKREAREHLLRIAAGADDGYDFAVSEQLHASR